MQAGLEEETLPMCDRFTDGFVFGLGQVSAYGLILLVFACVAYGIYRYFRYRFEKRARELAQAPVDAAIAAGSVAGTAARSAAAHASSVAAAGLDQGLHLLKRFRKRVGR